jgi:hypothetical protein
MPCSSLPHIQTYAEGAKALDGRTWRSSVLAAWVRVSLRGELGGEA